MDQQTVVVSRVLDQKVVESARSVLKQVQQIANLVDGLTRSSGLTTTGVLNLIEEDLTERGLTPRSSSMQEPEADDVIFIPDSTSTIRYVGRDAETNGRWRMEDDGVFVAEFIADGDDHAVATAQAIIQAYTDHFDR